jgi:CRISPR-associated exonuclease Cas4
MESQMNVRVSDVSLYLRCPRLVYFDSLGTLKRSARAADLLLREIMLRLEEGWSDSLQEHLAAEQKRLEVELSLIYPDLQSDDVAAAYRDIEVLIPAISRGIGPVMARLFPCAIEVDLRSTRLGLSGRLDRLVDDVCPSIIRTGNAPENGVWNGDRLALAGYSILLKERDGVSGNYDLGQVEYPRRGQVREVFIHGVDRARFLRIRERIHAIKDGRLPDVPKDAPCVSCLMVESCQSRRSLASRFF